jgi:NodT family efflux transporter outer membrane factor (OMF) lipoprotein
LWLTLASTAALAGCTLGPDFHEPQTDNPVAWGGEPSDVGSLTYGGPVDEHWWESFDDPELTSLVDRLSRQNIDLASALERVRQAQAETDVAAAQGLPHIGAQSLYTRTRESPNGVLSLVEPAPGAPLGFDLWENSLQSSWELDLFGRVRRAVEAQQANTEAAIEARHEIALRAIADLTQDYMQLRGTQAREAINRQNLALAQHDLRLVRDQFANGVATTLDVANADAQQATIAAELPPLREEAARLINAIGFLLAEPPRALEGELTPVVEPPLVPPSVPVGLPATLLRRRPDIREAEARLHITTAETGVAIASFFPDITLTGHVGLQGLQLANAFSMPDLEATVGPTISLPIFEGGQLRGTLKLRRSQQREAALDYRDAVLSAWQDVDNALTAYAEGQERHDLVATAIAKKREALAAAQQSYQQGAVDFLNVITAESALLQSEDDLAQSETEIETDLVSLYKALGGGWTIADQ